MPNDLTVDVGVVMSGSSLGDLTHTAPSLSLMKAIEANSDWSLALDSKGRIRHQYEDKVKKGFGRDWLRRLADRNKLRIVQCQRLNRGIRAALDAEHFDREDLKYVETAAETDCKLLVSHDPDYSLRVQRVLRRIQIRVAPADQLAPAPAAGEPAGS